MNIKYNAILLAALTSVAFTGCKSDKCCDPTTQQSFNDPFFPAEYQGVAEKTASPMAASAARADGTLRGYHFHGAALNSLGKDKLGLIFADDDTSEPYVIYLDTPASDANLSGRQDSVVAFAQSMGISQSQLKFESGENPGYTTPTAPLIKALPKTASDAGGTSASISGSN